MSGFVVDRRDLEFVLFTQARLEQLFLRERYRELDRLTVSAILDEATKFAADVLAPLNSAADVEGSHYDQATSRVTLAKGFREAYNLFCENGWMGFSANPAYGGQGMPYVLHLAVNDILFGSCLSFCLNPLLVTGAAHLVEAFGTDTLKRLFVQKMVNGIWGGTMCLTEPGAGSDVGAIRTRAKPVGDSYLIEGEKIFITFGEHDLTPNICHAVLARIDGAPEGTKGLSLFLVPKIRVKPDGSLGEDNDVRCSGVEHKHGIHASPTCSLLFGEHGRCQGYLLGEPHKGMRAMFQMMNEARISVGLQGASLANAAYQRALAYARERKQGKNLLTGKDAVLLEHPDVRQLLMWQKAIAEGTRALLLRTALFADLAATAPTAPEKAHYDGLVEMLTPICKAYSTDQGYESITRSLQTLGGYGYLKDYGIEQLLRDVKIASIYEGTNGIQAADLVGRKLTARGGADFRSLVAMIEELSRTQATHPVLAEELLVLAQARIALVEATLAFANAGTQDPQIPAVNASSYLDLMGKVVVGFLLLEQAVLAFAQLQTLATAKGLSPTEPQAVAKLCVEDAEASFLYGKIKVAQFFARRALALAPAQAHTLTTGDRSALEMVF